VALHRIAVRLRFWVTRKGSLWAANGDWAALGQLAPFLEFVTFLV